MLITNRWNIGVSYSVRCRLQPSDPVDPTLCPAERAVSIQCITAAFLTDVLLHVSTFCVVDHLPACLLLACCSAELIQPRIRRPPRALFPDTGTVDVPFEDLNRFLRRSRRSNRSLHI
jgi:hypothetical protein